MQNQDTPWFKKGGVIIPVLLGTVAGFLPTAVHMNWSWMLFCWLAWGSSMLWLTFLIVSSKTLRKLSLIMMSFALLIVGLQRLEEKWQKDNPIPRIVYRFPVNHLPKEHNESTAEETVKNPAAEKAERETAPDEAEKKAPAGSLPKEDLIPIKDEIRPVVRVKAVFKNSHDHPATYRIQNEGPRDVLQLRAQVLTHKVRKNGEIGSAGYEVEYVEKLGPHGSASYNFPEHCFDIPPITKGSAEVSAVEIRLSYLYGPNTRKAVKSLFYFLNPKRSWVGESDRSLTPEIYAPAKKALSEMVKLQNEQDTQDAPDERRP